MQTCLSIKCLLLTLAFLVLSGLRALKVLNLGVSDVSDAVLVHLKGGSCPFIIFDFYLYFALVSESFPFSTSTGRAWVSYKDGFVL